MEHATWVAIAEFILRVILGWRFLVSGLSNVRRWPNPVQTASLVFPAGAPLFGFVATVLMIAGGLGLAAGFQTPISALMVIVFLIPTFAVHLHWLKALPVMATVVENGLADKKPQGYFRSFERQAYHAHEVGIRDNLVFFAAAVFFLVRGSAAFGIDNWLSAWAVRLF